MRKWKQTFKVQGMSQDKAPSIETDERSESVKAYEIRNMRLSDSGNGNTMALTNERGTLPVMINNIYELDGVPLGTASVGGYLVVFAKSDSYDFIYRLRKTEEGSFEAVTIAQGYFNFEDRIETISYYENEKLLKVYWIDGKNCMRVMNILSDEIYESAKRFDSVPECVGHGESVVITKELNTQGVFSPGTVQYFFTYSNKYLAESNIFYQSQLFYCNSNNKTGDAPDSVSTCSFRIDLSSLDTDFGYVNCYSLARQSEGASPSVRLVKRIKIPESGEVTFVDTNTNSEMYDFTELASHTNVALIPDTFAIKANTMFVGNVRNASLEIPFTHSDMRSAFKNAGFFLKEPAFNTVMRGHYANTNQLSGDNRQTTTFKTREKYRFGIQFQHKRGYWSEVFWVGDYGNGCDGEPLFVKPKLGKTGVLGKISLPAFCGDIDSSIVNAMMDNGYVRIRPVVVYPDENDCEVICQGVVNPTVFNYEKRNGNNIYSQASWFFRPEDVTQAISDTDGGNFSSESYARDPDGTLKVVLQYEHYRCLPDNSHYNAEIQCNVYHTPYFNSVFFDKANTDSKKKTDMFFKDSFFVDRSVFTFNSPDIDVEGRFGHGQKLGYKFRVVGCITMDASVGGYRVIEPSVTNTFRDDPFSTASGLVNGKVYQHIRKMDGGLNGNPLASFLMWSDEMTEPNDNRSNPEGGSGDKRQYYEYGFMAYPWHRDGCLNNNNAKKGTNVSGSFKSKILANMRFSENTEYMDEAIDVQLEDSVSWNDMSDNPVGLMEDGALRLYSGSVDDVVTYGLGDYAGGQLDTRNVIGAKVNSCFSILKEIVLPGLPFLQVNAYISAINPITEKQAVGYRGGRHTTLFRVYYVKIGDKYRYIFDATNEKGRFLRYTGDSYYRDSIEWGWNDDTKETASSQIQYPDGTGHWFCYYLDKDDADIQLGTTAQIMKGDVYARFDISQADGANVRLRILGRSRKGYGHKKEEYYVWVTARELSSKQMGYPIVCTGPNRVEDNMYASKLTAAEAKLVDGWNYSTGKEAVIMRYSSTPHFVSSIKSSGTVQNILPSIKDSFNVSDITSIDQDVVYEYPEPEMTQEEEAKYEELKEQYGITSSSTEEELQAFIEAWNEWIASQDDGSDEEDSDEPEITSSSIQKVAVLSPFWDSEKTISEFRPSGDFKSYWTENTNIDKGKSVMLIGEYYKENSNKFGGDSQDAIERNIWRVGGEAVEMSRDNDVHVRWTEGDTYYQRYDCVKTLPYNDNDKNQIVECLSFMVETRINIDGRYDNKQGILDNTILTKDNVNRINTGYSQTDGAFTYSAFSDDSVNADEHHNDILWSERKNDGDIVDKWTNISTMNSMPSDNVYGKLVKLVSNGAGLYALNECSVGKILYNEQAAVQGDGNTVLFGINNAVNGIVILTNSYGCQNKWSVVDYDNYIVFTDNNAKTQLTISQDGVRDTATVLGMRSWFTKNNVHGSAFFDKVNREVMYVTDNDCLTLAMTRFGLAYTGLFDYAGALVENLSGDVVLVTSDNGKTKLWLKNKGENNMFFGERKEYHVTVLANAGSTIDKIFTNVEFRATTTMDGEDTDLTFDTLRCWNEYQDTEDEMIVQKGYYPADIKRKFRIWRAVIGRDKSNLSARANLDRIVNPWAYVTLKKAFPESEETVLNDIEIIFYLCDDKTFGNGEDNRK